eukprot:1154608-Pelagomonas_calceolata.AAC.3
MCACNVHARLGTAVPLNPHVHAAENQPWLLDVQLRGAALPCVWRWPAGRRRAGMILAVAEGVRGI